MPAQATLDFLVHGGGQLELDCRTVPWEVQKFFKLAVLGPIPGIAAPDDVFALVVPGGDCIIGGPGIRAVRIVPEFERDRLARRQPAEFFDGHAPIRRVQAFAEGEQRVMRGQRGDHPAVAFGHFDLRRERIGLDVDAPFAREVVFADLLRAECVDELDHQLEVAALVGLAVLLDLRPGLEAGRDPA